MDLQLNSAALLPPEIARDLSSVLASPSDPSLIATHLRFVVIATKICKARLSPNLAFRAIEDATRRIKAETQVDPSTIDIYESHTNRKIGTILYHPIDTSRMFTGILLYDATGISGPVHRAPVSHICALPVYITSDTS